MLAAVVQIGQGTKKEGDSCAARLHPEKRVLTRRRQDAKPQRTIPKIESTSPELDRASGTTLARDEANHNPTGLLSRARRGLTQPRWGSALCGREPKVAPSSPPWAE